MNLQSALRRALVSLGLLAGSSIPAAAAGAKAGDSPVAIVVPAQLIVAEIRIESDAPTWELKLGKISDARQFIRTAAESDGFSVVIEQPLISHHPQFGGTPGAGARSTGDGSADVVVSSRIDGSSDFVKIIQQCEGIVSRLSVENKVSASLVRISLALENPESMRSELLQQIRAYVEATAKALSDTPSYTISGLDQPVQVRQSGERDVVVSLPFTVAYGSTRAN